MSRQSILQESSMENFDSEYPTNEQMEEMFMAWKRDGKSGIMQVLQKLRQERQEAEAPKNSRVVLAPIKPKPCLLTKGLANLRVKPILCSLHAI